MTIVYMDNSGKRTGKVLVDEAADTKRETWEMTEKLNKYKKLTEGGERTFIWGLGTCTRS
jgi:hypothetical protein